MCAFKKGDRIRRKSFPDITSVVGSVPGDIEYDSRRFLAASEGFTLVGGGWEFQKNWELIEPAESSTNGELKIGDEVLGIRYGKVFEGYYIGNCHDGSGAEILIEMKDAEIDIDTFSYHAGCEGFSDQFMDTLPRGYVNKAHGIFSWVNGVKKVDKPKAVETHGGFKEGDTVLYTGMCNGRRVVDKVVVLGEYKDWMDSGKGGFVVGEGTDYKFNAWISEIKPLDMPKLSAEVPETTSDGVSLFSIVHPGPSAFSYPNLRLAVDLLRSTLPTFEEEVKEQPMSFFKKEDISGYSIDLGYSGIPKCTSKWKKLLNK
jgi:hypothetical protein